MKTKRSLALALYLGMSRLANGTVSRLLQRRLKSGKEDPERWREKLGEASLKRPDGKVIWFHAASVGEALSLLDLIKAVCKSRPDATVLLTTGTKSSAEMVKERLPEGASHQFAPVDTASAVAKFIAHWRPDVGVFVESELWPRMINDAHKAGVSLYLVNARISEKSVKRMRWAGAFSQSLLSRFKLILAQDETQANRFYRLGAVPEMIEITGSLKDTAAALPHDENELKDFMKDLAGKQVWLAASTHEGEEEIVSKAHRFARRFSHGLVLILVPRHPERADAIADYLHGEGWQVARRSAGEKLTRNTEIYLADSLGELGLWYRVAPTSFIGGSLVKIGGHNPFEAAHLGSAILHGPHVFNFEEAYGRFDAASAAVFVSTAEELGPRLIDTLPADRTAALAQAGWRVTSEGVDVAEYACKVILSGVEDATT